MIILFTTLHVIVCLFLVIVVLLQSGKAADLAGGHLGLRPCAGDAQPNRNCWPDGRQACRMTLAATRR